MLELLSVVALRIFWLFARIPRQPVQAMGWNSISLSHLCGAIIQLRGTMCLLVPVRSVSTHRRIISTCALHGLALTPAHQSKMRLSLVMSRGSQDVRWPTSSRQSIIVKRILKSQHLIITYMWCIIQLLSIGMTFALLQMVWIILPRFDRILKSRSVSHVWSNQQFCHLELLIFIIELVILSLNSCLVLLL